MSKPNKEAIKKAIENAFDKEHGGNTEARQIPVTIGDLFEFHLDDGTKLFTQRNEEINRKQCAWVDVNTYDGLAVSATQLTRKNNGLPLTGKTVAERIEAFTNLFNEEGILILKVVDIKQKAFQQPDGTTSISNYYVFEVLTGRANDEDEE